ncbi:MAG: lipoate--protein ligase family protein [Gammaproteobacteria bacterium]|nr:lipoate--protein ligase family protein [Gammaproteobacteria bacterium]NIR85505.1 lipoate--protein ligase family protein [Gammaproteobacteria bacterium]NIU06642.1 lipoate--protein ligase family protein [Gammaproteobacteria bacterium]NIX87915.1 lipoate--protein ligase family protein [Gammaproteobacteria bacterium]
MVRAAAQPWRVIDTGLRPAAENIAINRAMLEAHQAGAIPHTLRFLRFRPAALLGFHQSAGQELRVEYCRANGIDVQRRVTGGGAIYFDETQIGWELYVDKRTFGTADMARIARRVCEAAAAGISRLGVDARFRPRNDIEVAGRKLSGTGGTFDGESILYQGTLLVDFDVARMLRVLRIPAEKLSDKAVATARERVVNLRELLGYAPTVDEIKDRMTAAFAEAFGIGFEESPGLSDAERPLYESALEEIDTPGWVFERDLPQSEAPMLEGLHRAGGGLMRATVWIDRAREHVKQVMITGDFFVNPRRMVWDLEAALKDVPLAEVAERVHRFFDGYPVETLMLTRDDFVAAIEDALENGANRQDVKTAKDG